MAEIAGNYSTLQDLVRKYADPNAAGEMEHDDLTIQSVTQTAWGTVLLDTHGRLYRLEYGLGEWVAVPMPLTVQRTQVDDCLLCRTQVDD